MAESSGEAEFLSAHCGLRELVQFANVTGEFFGSDWMRLVAYIDASAAAGLLQRHGAGDMKSLDVKDMWAQETVARHEIQVRHISRVFNFSDILASPSDATAFPRHLDALGFQYR